MNDVIIKLKQTANGPMLTLPHDCYVGRSLDLYGEFSPGEQEFFKVCSRGGAALDVGANLGAHTVFMARNFSHVYGFEPQEVLFRILAANLATYGNKTLYNAAVGNEEGIIHLPLMDYSIVNNYGGYGRDMIKKAEKPEEIPLVKTQLRMLDKIEALRKEEQIDLIKVDVEGMEKDVLEGAQYLIDKHKPILYVENDRPEKQKDLVRLIYNLGYTATWHLTPLFRPDNFNGYKENVFGGLIVSINLICIHKENAWLKITGGEPCTPEKYGQPAGCVL
jgi:FkbM family methyltransferase